MYLTCMSSVKVIPPDGPLSHFQARASSTQTKCTLCAPNSNHTPSLMLTYVSSPCRFGGLLHDWPESYFQAQQTKGVGLAGIFKQAIGQHQAQKTTKARSVLARMIPGSAMAKLGTQVSCR